MGVPGTAGFAGADTGAGTLGLENEMKGAGASVGTTGGDGFAGVTIGMGALSSVYQAKVVGVCSGAVDGSGSKLDLIS